MQNIHLSDAAKSILSDSMNVLGSRDMVATVNNSSNNKITNNKITNNKSKNINNNNNSISSGDMVARVEEELTELARNNSRLARYIQMVNQVSSQLDLLLY